jgi:hypothetical protein
VVITFFVVVKLRETVCMKIHVMLKIPRDTPETTSAANATVYSSGMYSRTEYSTPTVYGARRGSVNDGEESSVHVHTGGGAERV